MAGMNPGMSPWFTVISPVAGFLPTTSPCSGYFLVRLQPMDTVSNSMADMSTNWGFESRIVSSQLLCASLGLLCGDQ
jgi:hypothetical protein